jgi:uncharacterized membrane protein
VETGRLETFADGVFAIAATLLILNVGLTHHGSLTHQLAHAWIAYAGYAVSFGTIGIMWANHHECLRHIDRADRVFIFLNLGLLLCVAFIPFPTSVLVEALRAGHGGRAAAVFYGIVLSTTAVLFNSVWLYAARENRLIAPEADRRLVTGITRSFRPGVPMYVTGTLLGLVSGWAGAITFAAIAIFYVISASFFGQEESPEA